MLEFLNVRPHSGGKHQNDDAQFTDLRQELCLSEDIQPCGAEDQACQQRTYHLRHLKPLGYQPQQLGAQEDQGQIY